ncbi:acyltransferase [Escherichia coli]|nr:acyltransferase [Escherichia coli]
MRNFSIDKAKILAAFCIVLVHSGTYPEFGYYLGGVFGNISRWALPFFFLTSGYYFGLSNAFDITKRVNKLISILFWISLIYLPLRVIKSFLSSGSIGNSIFSLNSFVGGVYFHLWFLVSLVVAFLILGYAINNGSRLSVAFFSVVLIALFWVFDIVNSSGTKTEAYYLFRLLFAFPIFFIGFKFAKNNYLQRFSSFNYIVMIFFGLVFVVSETSFLYFKYGFDLHERQFPLGVLLISVGVLGLCLTNISNNKSYFSLCGKKYSLGVYLLHPLFLVFFSDISKK